MRKFKIKNRIKRKYTRKTQTQNPFNFYRSIGISLIPTFFIIISAFSFFIIFQQSFIKKQPNLNLTLPNIPAVSFPKINYKIPELNIDSYKIDIRTFLTTISISINKTVNSTKNLINNIFHNISINLKLLDPKPAITQLLNTGKYISTGFTKLFNSSIKLLINYAQKANNFIISATTSLFNILKYILLTILSSTSKLIIAIINIISFLFKWSLNILNYIFISIYNLAMTLISYFKFAISYLFTLFINLIILVKNILINILISIYRIFSSLIVYFYNALVKFFGYLFFTFKSLSIFINEQLDIMSNSADVYLNELSQQLQPAVSVLYRLANILKKSAYSLISTADMIINLASSDSKNSPAQQNCKDSIMVFPIKCT